MFAIVALTAVIAIIWLVWTFVADYRATVGTTWQRLIAAAGHSATKLWAKFTMLVGLMSGAAVYLADFLGHPEFDAAIKTALKPELVTVYMVVVAVVTIWARNRTAKKG